MFCSVGQLISVSWAGCGYGAASCFFPIINFFLGGTGNRTQDLTLARHPIIHFSFIFNLELAPV